MHVTSGADGYIKLFVFHITSAEHKDLKPVPGDGEVDYNEFCGLMKDLVSSASSMEGDIKEAFAHIDVDGDGKVSQTELRAAVVRLGEKMSEKEADDLIKTVDINGDDHIDYEGKHIYFKIELILKYWL